jgi:arabinogalactan endo-1,4-beta-galactosidase
MRNSLVSFFLIIILASCEKATVIPASPEPTESFRISAVDISSFPEIDITTPVFYDLDSNQNNFLEILKENGVNTIRLRLWVNPANEHFSFKEVGEFSQTLKTQGFKTWLTLHYSDTWADPGHQETPQNWQGLNQADLKDSTYQYTKRVVLEMKPDFIQIGNEINTGFLHPSGHISNNYTQFLELMDTAIKAVREHSSNSEIIIHFAGIDGSDWFYNQVSSLDYDIIGLSYYPIWHGKILIDLKDRMEQLSSTHFKDIIIAETAYPFTLSWNDWTTNIVGLEEQLILPDYPANQVGQNNFVNQIKTISTELEYGRGFCYWGAELIAWKGTQATDGSTWENQALFNFNNRALPVLQQFNLN